MQYLAISVVIILSSTIKVVIKRMHTAYVQIFKRCNFQGFRGELAICKIFILEISLANFDLHKSESRILGDPQNKIAKMLDL